MMNADVAGLAQSNEVGRMVVDLLMHASYRNLHPSIFSGNTMQSKGIDVL